MTCLALSEINLCNTNQNDLELGGDLWSLKLTEKREGRSFPLGMAADEYFMERGGYRSVGRLCFLFAVGIILTVQEIG